MAAARRGRRTCWRWGSPGARSASSCSASRASSPTSGSATCRSRSPSCRCSPRSSWPCCSSASSGRARPRTSSRCTASPCSRSPSAASSRAARCSASSWRRTSSSACAAWRPTRPASSGASRPPAAEPRRRVAALVAVRPGLAARWCCSSASRCSCSPPGSTAPTGSPCRAWATRRTRAVVARTGFSEEIDLRRVGTLTNDDAVAFTVRMTDLEGDPPAAPARRPALARPGAGPLRERRVAERTDLLQQRDDVPVRRPGGRRRPGPRRRLHFQFQGRTRSLFLAEPIYPASVPGKLPIAVTEPAGLRPALFFEAGGTVLSVDVPARTRRTATRRTSIPARPGRRYPAVRVSDVYQIRLLRCGAPGMEELTTRLLARPRRGRAVAAGARGIAPRPRAPARAAAARLLGADRPAPRRAPRPLRLLQPTT